MQTKLAVFAALVSLFFVTGCGKKKSTPKDTKKPAAAGMTTPMADGMGATKAAPKAKVPAFKGALESSPWVVKELTAAGFGGLTMRVPKNAEIKKDPVNNKVGNVNNMDGFAIWLSREKLDMAAVIKAVKKSGLRPFQGFVEQKPDHIIYKFKGITGKTQIYFQVALKVDGKDYSCKALGGITISEKELPQVKQVIKACKTLKKK